MARATTRTLLSLDDFARYCGIHPLHFNGVEHSTLAPATTCGMPMLQYPWQNSDAISREDIAMAIAEAEGRMSQQLGFRLKPAWEIDERHSWPQNRLGAWWMNPSLKADWGHMVAGGIEGKQVISNNATCVYTDEDGDGYNETVTITANTTVTADPNEVAIYFPGMDADPDFEIRPIKVTIGASTMTIKARREQFVLPELQDSLAANRAIDGSADANFAPNVDVYRVFHDPSQQIHFLWEGVGGCGCGVSTCPTCFLTGQFGCTVVRDYRLGMITGSPANWNSVMYNYEGSAPAVFRTPDRVRLWYRAGWRSKGDPRWAHNMDPMFGRAVAAYAVTFLDRPICGCENVRNLTARWNDDLALSEATQGVGKSYKISSRQLDNPLGTAQGALYAWRMISRMSLGDAVWGL